MISSVFIVIYTVADNISTNTYVVIQFAVCIERHGDGLQSEKKADLLQDGIGGSSISASFIQKLKFFLEVSEINHSYSHNSRSIF